VALVDPWIRAFCNRGRSTKRWRVTARRKASNTDQGRGSFTSGPVFTPAGLGLQAIAISMDGRDPLHGNISIENGCGARIQIEECI